MLILLFSACGGAKPAGGPPSEPPAVIGRGVVELPDRYPRGDTASGDTGDTSDTGADAPYTGTRWVDLEMGYNPCFLREDGAGTCLDVDIFGEAPDESLVEVGRGVGLNGAGEWRLWGAAQARGDVVPQGAGFHDLHCESQYCAAIAGDGSIAWVAPGEIVTRLDGAFVDVAEGEWNLRLCGLRESGVVTCWDDGGVATDILAGDYRFISIVSDTVCGYGDGEVVDCWQGSENAGWDEGLTPPGDYVAACGFSVAGCGILRDTSLRCWGYGNDYSGAPITGSGGHTGLAKLSIGRSMGCFITLEGELICWPGDSTPVE